MFPMRAAVGATRRLSMKVLEGGPSGESTPTNAPISPVRKAGVSPHDTGGKLEAKRIVQELVDSALDGDDVLPLVLDPTSCPCHVLYR